MNEEDAATLFNALSNADRLKVIRALVVAGPNGLNAGDIAQSVGASPSRASFHLSALTDAGILTRERQARSLIYTINFARIGALMTFLLEDCCAGSPELKTCCAVLR